MVKMLTLRGAVALARPSASRLIGRGYLRCSRRPMRCLATLCDDRGTRATPPIAAERNSAAEVEPSRVPYQIVNFYHLVDIEKPDQVVREHKEWMQGHDIRGRIYFSSQGVNAQFTGPMTDTEAYLDWIQNRPPFEKLQWNCDPVDQHMFPKLRLKVKPNLVQLSGGLASLPVTQPEQRATPLSPESWRALLKDAVAFDASSSKPVVLDVRNGYEWDAGHFDGAVRPKEDAFSETPVAEVLPEPLAEVHKETPVLMYCTGGIRCDIYSTVLRKNGFQNLYSLEGGVQKYFKEVGSELWDGSLFVFDGRMAIDPQNVDGSIRALPSSIRCQVCGGPGKVPHVNCANVDCNRLFVACDACKESLKGCCCTSCMEAPRLLRPAQTSGGYYGKFGTYAMDRFKRSCQKCDLTLGQIEKCRSVTAATERQLRRRERRLERVRERREIAKRLRLEWKKRCHAEEEARGEPSSNLKDALSHMKGLMNRI